MTLFRLPERYNATPCRACRADMVWIEHQRKDGTPTKIPLDLGSRTLRDDRYWCEAHFARCPRADEFRGRRRAR